MSKHEDTVKAKIDARCAAGFAKYKKTMERTDLTRLQWLQHAQDEAMDLAIYLQRLIDDEPQDSGDGPVWRMCALRAQGNLTGCAKCQKSCVLPDGRLLEPSCYAYAKGMLEDAIDALEAARGAT